MAAPNNLSLLFLFLSVSLLLSFDFVRTHEKSCETNEEQSSKTHEKSSRTADISTMVKQICESTDHPSLCLTILLPRLGGNSDITTVLEIAVRTTSDLAKSGVDRAKTLAADPTIPRELASVLQDCRGSYENAVEDFNKTLKAFPTRDIGSMRTRLSAVMTVVEDCQDGLAGYGKESPFTDVAERLTNMTSNCLAIIALLNN